MSGHKAAVAPKGEMKECVYPHCLQCTLSDCTMDTKDINAMMKRRRWASDPEAYRQKQRDYRKRMKDYLPQCDKCESCVLVRKDKGEGYRRLCIAEMRLIEQKVANSPHWCRKRKS